MMDSNRDNESAVLDFPELLRHQGQSSPSDDVIGDCAEGVHLGVAVAVMVDEQQEPRVYAVPTAPNADNKPVAFYKTTLFCKIALILLIAIIIIGLATIAIILLTGENDSVEGDGGDREKLGIRQAIEALVGTEKLESPESPYAKALDWMIRQDPMELVPGVDSNLVQRYIMAYFYYATTANGPWRSCNPAVGNELEFCYLIKVPAIRWLGSVHECQFAGVACNDKMQVIRLELSKSISVVVSVQYVIGPSPPHMPSNVKCVSIACRWSTTVGWLPCWYCSSSLS
jgi:hypothetical protein